MPTRLDMKVSALPSREERSWAGHFAEHTRWMKLLRERAGKQFVRKRGGECQKIVKTRSKPGQSPVKAGGFFLLRGLLQRHLPPRNRTAPAMLRLADFPAPRVPSAG